MFYTMVGTKCIVTLQTSNIVRILANEYVKGVDQKPFFTAGSTFFKLKCEEEPPSVEIKLPYYFAYNTLRSGKRKDQIPLTNDYGEPVPQISLLVALNTQRPMDWLSAIELWSSVRTNLTQGTADTAGKGLEFLNDDIEVLLPALPEKAYPLSIDGIQALESWTKEWIFAMVKAGHLHYLEAWDKAARRALERFRIVDSKSEFIDGLGASGVGEVDEMARVLRAIKKATLVGGGVPYISRVATILANDSGPKMAPERLRTLRSTLGFGWIPSEPDWENDWAPLAKTMGWI